MRRWKLSLGRGRARSRLVDKQGRGGFIQYVKQGLDLFWRRVVLRVCRPAPQAAQGRRIHVCVATARIEPHLVAHMTRRWSQMEFLGTG